MEKNESCCPLGKIKKRNEKSIPDYKYNKNQIEQDETLGNGRRKTQGDWEIDEK